MRRRWVSSLTGLVAVALVLWTFGATPAWAQGFAGGLRGAVKDANGVIPGVTVTLTNGGTSISRTTVTNDVGEYTFAAVHAGRYSLKATLQGFKTFEQKGLRDRHAAVHHAGDPPRGRHNRGNDHGDGGGAADRDLQRVAGEVLDSETMRDLPSLAATCS